MKNTILTLLTASLIAASTMQFASAAERHHVRKPVASQQFRNANNAVSLPVQADPAPGYAYHGFSAPAGQ